jgi:hypothetical protein
MHNYIRKMGLSDRDDIKDQYDCIGGQEYYGEGGVIL